MTARVWTVEELDRVHRLPEGWRWEYDEREWGWHARGPQNAIICVDGHCEVLAGCGGADSRAVALAVILASQGRESFEMLAQAVEREVFTAASHDPIVMAWAELHREVIARIAAMLRRGRVEP
jgi:hypothetical protein